MNFLKARPNDRITLLQRLARRVRFAKWQNHLLSPLSVNPDPRIIVLGNQKAGTTAIAALLAYALGFSVTLDFPDIYQPLNCLYSQDSDFTDFVRHYRFCFSRNIVKEPNLTFFYPALRQMFPNAQFVFVVRDPRDNIRSMLNRLNLPGDVTQTGVGEVALPNKVWRAILTGEWLSLPRSINYVETLAQRWNLATAVYEQSVTQMQLARYESFLADKVGFIYDLADRLGQTPQRDISDRVNIQFQPRGNRQISWTAFFGKQNLSRIERICGPQMARFDYHIPLDSSALNSFSEVDG